MISNSPTVADGEAGTAPPAASGIGSWFTRSNVGLLREVALLPVLILLIVVGTVTSPAFLTVSNFAGAGTTTGTVTVTETMPPDLTLVSMAGIGWTCPSAGTTCTRSDSLPSGSSYPPITVGSVA